MGDKIIYSKKIQIKRAQQGCIEGGFLGFQETPIDSRTISIITSLSKYKTINTT